METNHVILKKWNKVNQLSGGRVQGSRRVSVGVINSLKVVAQCFSGLLINMHEQIVIY